MNLEKLRTKVPDFVFDQLPAIVEQFEVNSNRRLAHFLAQCAHESGGFKAVSENLNYSAEGLVKIFPKYFPNVEFAKKYARQAELIANRVYSNRMGNGDEASGDGWKFRGRGYIQLTGKTNYIEFDKFVPEDIISDPNLVATKYPLLSAGFFFFKNKLHGISDRGDSVADITALTKRVNGGTHGLDDRIARFNNFNEILNA